MSLARFLRSNNKSDFSWIKPNRRFISQGLYLPSLYNPCLEDIAVITDSSGSVSDAELNQFTSETTAILHDLNPEYVHFIQCDSEVKDYNKGFNLTHTDDELATEFITKKLDSLNERLIKGEIKHAHYRKSVKTLNAKMEKGNYDNRIVIPDTNAQLDALIEISYAWDMIVDKDTGEPIDALWGVTGCV